jgi:plasmid stabilization system protein ParE
VRRYILAPEAALDLAEIWRYLKNKASVEVAERVVRLLLKERAAARIRAVVS